MARPDADKPNLPEVLPPAVPARPHGPRVPAPWNGAPPSQQGGGDALAMLKALRRRWPVALGLGLLLAGGGAAAAWFLLAGSFTSFAVIRIASTPPWIVARNVDTPEGQREFLTYQRTQAMQIKSHLVLNAALKRDEVKRLAVVARQPDPIAWLEDELKVDFQEGSEFITVTMRGPEPDELLTLVNAVVKAYEKEVVEAETDRRRKRVKELDAIYVEAGNRLRKKKDSLREMADELGTSEAAALTQKQVTMQAYLGELKKQHAQARAELMKAKAKLASHRSQEKALTDPPVPEAAVTEVVEADPEVKQHLTRISRLQEVVADYEQRAVNPNETVKLRAERELASLRKKVDGRREQARSALVERLRQKAKADYDAQLAALTSEVELWAQQEKTLRDEVAGQGQETEKVGRSSTAFELLKAEVDREEKLAERVGNEVDILRMELRSPPRVSVFQEAALQKKDAKKQLFATLLAAVAGLAGACFGVGWWESRARRVHTAEEVATGLGLRVVGAVPPLPVPALRLPTVVAEAEAGGHQLLESIDGIRTMLLRDASSSGRRLLLVTSAVSGEGKTTLASHLAGSLARAGRRTLLIDCDLRRPTLHQLFEVPPHPGFSEALLGEVPLAEATRATSVPGLWIMPAGQWDRGVLRALAGEELQKAFATLRQHYDFVVIDSHPVLLATDSLLVGMHADAVILSLMKDVSRVPRASAACQRLADLGIPVLGAVVNGLPEDDYGGAYPYPAAATATAAS